MAYVLQPRQELLDPNYWGGIDIENPGHFPHSSDGHTYIDGTQRRHAAVQLAYCLAQVLEGDYTEAASLGGPVFDPLESHAEDGTVVVIDTESLSKWHYPPGHEKSWNLARLPATTSPPISLPYAEYWRAHTGSHHFSDEQAVFPDKHIIYGRSLEWGVVLSRKGSTRVVSTWAFAAARAGAMGISVPSFGPGMFRTAKELPIEVGKPVASKELVTPTFAMRSITRVTDLRVIHPAHSMPGKGPSLLDRLKAAKDAFARSLGTVTIPRPDMIPQA